MRYRWALIAAVLLALLGAGGVAMAWPRDGDAPGPAPTTASPAPPSPSASGSPTSPADREKADRAAVEQAWQEFWTVRDAVESGSYPQNQWPTVVGRVAVDPTYTRLISAATQFRNSGLRAYGAVMFHPYWTRPIAGTTTAMMGDCMDTSHTGSMYVKTGAKRTVGKTHDNTRVTLVRGADGRWRVKLIESLVGQQC
jgi:hypothetical protein